MRIVQWGTALVVVALALWGLSAGNKMYQAHLVKLKAEELAKAQPPEPLTEEEKEKLDYYRTNPFDLAAKGEHPKAVVEEREFFFERMALGAVGEHEFVLRNDGPVPLKVAKGPTMCKCTIHTVKEQEVAPGEELRIPVKYEPKDSGLFSQTVTIWTNDPENPEINLQVSGEMFPAVGTAPGNGWTLGSIELNTDIPLTGWIFSPIDPDFKVLDVIPSTDQITATLEPVPEEEFEALKVDHGIDAVRVYQINAVLEKSEIAGRVDEHIQFKTNNKDVPEITLTVTANRIGPFRIVASGWFSGEQLLRIGRVKAAEGKKHKLTLMVDSFDEDLRISDLQVEPAFLQIHLNKEESAASSKFHRYTLEVEVPPGAPKGVWDGPRKGKVTFHTNHPKVPEYEFWVELENL